MIYLIDLEQTMKNYPVFFSWVEVTPERVRANAEVMKRLNLSRSQRSSKYVPIFYLGYSAEDTKVYFVHWEDKNKTKFIIAECYLDDPLKRLLHYMFFNRSIDPTLWSYVEKTQYPTADDIFQLLDVHNLLKNVKDFSGKKINYKDCLYWDESLFTLYRLLEDGEFQDVDYPDDYLSLSDDGYPSRILRIKTVISNFKDLKTTIAKGVSLCKKSDEIRQDLIVLYFDETITKKVLSRYTKNKELEEGKGGNIGYLGNDMTYSIYCVSPIDLLKTMAYQVMVSGNSKKEIGLAKSIMSSSFILSACQSAVMKINKFLSGQVCAIHGSSIQNCNYLCQSKNVYSKMEQVVNHEVCATHGFLKERCDENCTNKNYSFLYKYYYQGLLEQIFRTSNVKNLNYMKKVFNNPEKYNLIVLMSILVDFNKFMYNVQKRDTFKDKIKPILHDTRNAVVDRYNNTPISDDVEVEKRIEGLLLEIQEIEGDQKLINYAENLVAVVPDSKVVTYVRDMGNNQLNADNFKTITDREGDFMIDGNTLSYGNGQDKRIDAVRYQKYHSLFKTFKTDKLPLRCTISFTTARICQLASFSNCSTVELTSLIYALFGFWNKDCLRSAMFIHSYHEMFLVAKNFGVPYKYGQYPDELPNESWANKILCTRDAVTRIQLYIISRKQKRKWNAGFGYSYKDKMNAANFLIKCLQSHFDNQEYISQQVKKYGPVIAKGNLSEAFSQIIHMVPEWFLDHGLRKYRPARIKAIKKINRPETLKQQMARREKEKAIQHDINKAIKEEHRAARRKIMEDSRSTHAAALAKAREEAKVRREEEARLEAVRLAEEKEARRAERKAKRRKERRMARARRAAGRAIQTKLAVRHEVERQEAREAARDAAGRAIETKVAAIKAAEKEKKDKQRTWSDVFWDALDDFNLG
ncbi:hypothetical protein [uncultured Shewanella sp.]|uniref:hypothetical protein n=1 Tax=uncultured Shewanella sp. TaxID=173975 RepID=UPI002635BAC7|nr:hypothetical protein [uncultured Shewanella sp.]